jgi:hypothetical protein
MTEAKASDLDEDLKRLAKRLDALDNDYIVRMAASNYKAMVRKAKADFRKRMISNQELR